MNNFGSETLQSPTSKHQKQLEDELIFEKTFIKMNRKKPFYNRDDPKNYISGLQCSVLTQQRYE